MALFLPRRWRRQPTGPVRINHGNPVARGIIAAYPMWRGATWNALGGAATITGTRAGGANVAGEWFDLDGASYLTRNGTLLPSDTTPFTVSWYSVPHAVPTYPSIMGTRPTGSANPFFIIRGAAPNYYLSAGPVAGLTTICAWTSGAGSLPALTAGMEERMVLICAGGTSSHNVLSDYRLVRNGVDFGNAPNAATAYGSSTATTEVHGWDGGDDEWDGLFGDFIVWGRKLSVAEALEYSNAPYQIYAPLVRRSYFGVAGGASSYTYAGSGTVTISGAATLLKGKIGAASGTVTVSGAATTSFTSGATTYTYAGSGTVVVSGAAGLVKGKIGPASGTVVVSGAAATEWTAAGATSYPYAGSGTITVSGAFALLKGKTVAGSGTITVSGAAATSRASASGGAVTATLTGDGSAVIGLCDTGTPVTPSQSAEY